MLYDTNYSIYQQLVSLCSASVQLQYMYRECWTKSRNFYRYFHDVVCMQNYYFTSIFNVVNRSQPAEPISPRHISRNENIQQINRTVFFQTPTSVKNTLNKAKIVTKFVRYYRRHLGLFWGENTKRDKLPGLHTQKHTNCNKFANKLSQICSQVGNKMCSHCLFPIVGTNCISLLNNLQQA